MQGFGSHSGGRGEYEHGEVERGGFEGEESNSIGVGYAWVFL